MPLDTNPLVTGLTVLVVVYFLNVIVLAFLTGEFWKTFGRSLQKYIVTLCIVTTLEVIVILFLSGEVVAILNQVGNILGQ